ncbi:alpha-L-fucosidase [Chitinophaga ginsengisegetis]|uniref:alpha-L-fucosidase n=1 Tax=Chitinophaga ginsengisegetis TaxID=393003 RepID=UPI000DB998B4|nr:alpha-L-fucosidase [Chitinophaga ginsengisegetis]MDR6569722.1 alpha-L-fucosidase [Chitinophaga ginsengisegetis]MDR6649455.1 alpha-L-fucosidase [Chitinophaga ginsengisegetis]MDR6655805.1 alpha-L-fucosidase [Chitinophaga ginsengisegetis]
MKKNTLLLAGLLGFNMAMAQEIKPYGALPSKAQVSWNDMEYYMFIHFGPNTFTNKEWGHGDEDPKVFNPTHLDARQWARTAKAAGMKGIVITAKHHDGFCLWPSKYSTHTVRESAWKDGKGDVLAELSAACKEYGLKFGVYLSPWDRNHPEYGKPGYNQVFANTLNEVLSSYGPVFEQWFDGANGGNIKQPYDWNLFHSVVYKNQPNAVIFSDVGPGCRWVGNENGIAGTTNWSTLNVKGFAPGANGPATRSLNEGNEDGEQWIPAECDVSIRPGWFYSPETNDKVKSVSSLLDIYYGSVGRNGNLILNVPVDRDGLIHPNDSTRLMELRRVLDASFKNNLAKRAVVTATNTRSNNKAVKVSNLNDGTNTTYWATTDDATTTTITLTYKQPVTFNRLVLQEYIALGQRVKTFNVEVLEQGVWKQIASETTIGHKRILRLKDYTTTQVRINILDAKAAPVISEVQLYKAPGLLTLPQIGRTADGKVWIHSESGDPDIHYTLDGSEPTVKSPKYISAETTVINLPRGGVVRAKAFLDNGKTASETVTATFDIAAAKWKVISPEAAAKDNDPAKAIDGSNATVYVAGNKGYPHELQVDLGETLSLKGFTYTPPVGEGIIYGYEFYTSTDGKNWGSPVASGQFANIKNNPVQQTVAFKKTSARYIRFVATSPADEKQPQAAIAELGVITR